MKDASVIVKTSSGMVRGREGYRFLGIPYGRADRFRPAQKASWEGVLDAGQYRSRSAQPNALGKWPEGLPFSLVGGEDCLNLNVWTPTLSPEAKLPVLIYVHGGAFQVGGNDEPGRAGDRFMGDTPMVFVSVNYRLGALGGLYLADRLGPDYADSGNLAELDVLLAVRWVKENAAAFGGDGEKICLLGISAGAKCIGALMTLPEADGLFSRVVLESGAQQAFRDTRTASQVTERFLRTARVREAGELLTMDLETLIRAQAEFCDCEGSTAFFGPVLDDRTFSEDWRARWEAGRCWKGEALVGSGHCEMVLLTESEVFEREKDRILSQLFGDRAAEVREICAAAGVDWTRGLSDAMYRSPSDTMAKTLALGGDRVWVYSFDYPPAHHGMGFHFLMRQQESAYCRVPEAERESAAAVAETMNRAARAFIAEGDPDPAGKLGWEPLSDRGEGEKLCFGKTVGKRGFSGDSLSFRGMYTLELG